MIFASIVYSLPVGIQVCSNIPEPVFVVMMPFVALGVIVAIIFVQVGQRGIPVR